MAEEFVLVWAAVEHASQAAVGKQCRVCSKPLSREDVEEGAVEVDVLFGRFYFHKKCWQEFKELYAAGKSRVGMSIISSSQMG